MKTRKVLILLLAALLLAACGGGDTGSNATDSGDTAEEANEAGAGGDGTEVTVTAANFAFSPAMLSLKPGEEVSLTFVNDDSAPHTFTSEDLGIDITADAGETARGSFRAPDSGSVQWQCTIHPQMTGTITVGGGSAKGAGDDKKKKEDKGSGDSGGMYDY